MSILDLLNGIREFYKGYPIIASLIIGLGITVLGYYFFQRYLNRNTSDLRDLDVSFQERRKAIVISFLFIIYVFFALYSFSDFDWINPFSMTGTMDLKASIEACVFYSILFLFLLFGSRKIGTVLTEINNYSSFFIVILLVIWGTIFVLEFTCKAVFITDTFLRILIASALCSFIMSIVLSESMLVKKSYVKLSNGKHEYFVYYKYGDYYLCGNSPSKASYTGSLLLSNEVIVKEHYIFYPIVIEPICYTKSVKDASTSSIKKYDICIRGVDSGAAVQKIKLQASYRNILGKELFNREYYFEGVVRPGEEKRIKRVKIKSRKVFQCKLEVVDYMLASNDIILNIDQKQQGGEKQDSNSYV